MRWNGRTRAPLLATVLTLGGLQGCSRADSPEARTSAPEEAYGKQAVEPARTVPPGTSLVFSVDQVVSTATHARGDVFSATLRHRVTDVEGGEAIPEGVPSQWIVTEASTEDGATVLAVRLESIRVNGSWTPLVGDVTEAHIRTSAAEDSAADTASGEAGPEIAIGTEANEVLTDILGEDGLAEGAIPTDDGTMVTVTTRGRSATLPAGSAITVQLTEPLEV
jgi:hypothetical protein